MAGAGYRRTAGRQARPSSAERSEAATTASSTAVRSPPASRARRPCRGGAARRGDRGPQGGRVLVARLEEGGRPEDRLHRQHLGDLPRQPDEHPRLDHALGQHEDVRRSRPGEARHGIELVLGNPHDHAHRLEHRCRPVEVRWRGPGTGGDGRRADTHDGRGVGHGPDHRDVGSDRGLDRGRRDPRRDGEQPRDTDLFQRHARLDHVAGLHGEDRALGRNRLGEHLHVGEGELQLGPTLREAFDHRQLVGRRPARDEQPSEEGLTHPTTTEDLEAHHGRSYSGPGALLQALRGDRCRASRRASTRAPLQELSGPGGRRVWSHFPDGFPCSSARPGWASP